MILGTRTDGTLMEGLQDFVGSILSGYIYIGNILTAMTVPIIIALVILLVLNKIREAIF